MVTRIKGTNLGYCGFSINPELLEKPYVNKTIREALMDQRRAIRRDVERENGKLRLLKNRKQKDCRMLARLDRRNIFIQDIF